MAPDLQQNPESSRQEGAALAWAGEWFGLAPNQAPAQPEIPLKAARSLWVTPAGLCAPIPAGKGVIKDKGSLS